jgi:hypothetical protein
VPLCTVRLPACEVDDQLCSLRALCTTNLCRLCALCTTNSVCVCTQAPKHVLTNANSAVDAASCCTTADVACGAAGTVGRKNVPIWSSRDEIVPVTHNCKGVSAGRLRVESPVTQLLKHAACQIRPTTPTPHPSNEPPTTPTHPDPMDRPQPNADTHATQCGQKAGSLNNREVEDTRCETYWKNAVKHSGEMWCEIFWGAAV